MQEKKMLLCTELRTHCVPYKCGLSQHPKQISFQNHTGFCETCEVRESRQQSTPAVWPAQPAVQAAMPSRRAQPHQPPAHTVRKQVLIFALLN